MVRFCLPTLWSLSLSFEFLEADFYHPLLAMSTKQKKRKEIWKYNLYNITNGGVMF